MSQPSERQDVSKLDYNFSSGSEDHTARLYKSAYESSGSDCIYMPKDDDPIYKYFPKIDPLDPDDPIGGGWKPHFPKEDPIWGRDPFKELPEFPFHSRNPDTTKPSDCEERDAEKKLDKEISGLIPECDKQNLKDANHALLTGDQRALATVLAKYKDDPEKLKAFTDEMNRELKDAHAGVGIHTTSDGKVEVYRENGHRSVEIDPKTGEISVRHIMVGPDGQVFVGDKDPDVCPSKVMEHVADRAVNKIEDPFSGIFDRDPIWGSTKDPYRRPWIERPKFDPTLMLL